jgi:hypothetical protein
VVVAPLRRYLLSVVDGSNGSTAAHLEALEALDQHPYTPLGDGLGQIGSIVDAGTESTLATLVLQLGLVLGVLYVGATLWLLWSARRSWSGTVPRATYVLLLLALGLSWFTSEQWMTFNSGLTFAVMLGVGVTRPQPRTPAVPSRRRRPPVTRAVAVLCLSSVLDAGLSSGGASTQPRRRGAEDLGDVRVWASVAGRTPRCTPGSTRSRCRWRPGACRPCGVPGCRCSPRAATAPGVRRPSRCVRCSRGPTSSWRMATTCSRSP